MAEPVKCDHCGRKITVKVAVPLFCPHCKKRL